MVVGCWLSVNICGPTAWVLHWDAKVGNLLDEPSRLSWNKWNNTWRTIWLKKKKKSSQPCFEFQPQRRATHDPSWLPVPDDLQLADIYDVEYLQKGDRLYRPLAGRGHREGKTKCWQVSFWSWVVEISEFIPCPWMNNFLLIHLKKLYLLKKFAWVAVWCDHSRSYSTSKFCGNRWNEDHVLINKLLEKFCDVSMKTYSRRASLPKAIWDMLCEEKENIYLDTLLLVQQYDKPVQGSLHSLLLGKPDVWRQF